MPDHAHSGTWNLDPFYRWKELFVDQNPNTSWREWGRGIADLRPEDPYFEMVAGRKMRHAMDKAEEMIEMAPCEHKIGICYDPYKRFVGYQKADRKWQPWLLGLLALTKTQDGAQMLAASIIYELERSGLNIDRNYNYTINMTYGGEDEYTTGPYDRPEPHWVYIALKPLPPQTDHERRMADFVKSFHAPTAASAQADASAHAAASAQADASTHAAASAQAEAQGPWANAAEWGQHDEEESDGEEEVQLLDEVSNDGWYRQGEELSLEF